MTPRPVSRWIAALAVLVVFLGGCATVPEDPEARERQFEERREAIASVADWKAGGRAAIITPDENASVSMDWEQTGEAYRLDMRAPMGAGSFRLEGGVNGVVLRASDGTEERAADAGELLYRYSGFDLPVEVLPWWLRGLPAPGMEVSGRELDDRGRVTAMEQAGWRITYTAYQRREGPDLPGRVFMDGPEGLSLRASIRNWEFEP